MLDLAPPKWLSDTVYEWLQRLHMQEWKVGVQLALVMQGNPDTLALCEQYPDINYARITFRADVEDTPAWHETIAHELLHVKHSRIDNYLERTVFPSLADQEFGYRVYASFYEPYIDAMAKALVELTTPPTPPVKAKRKKGSYVA